MSFYPWTASREERLKFIQEIINKKTPYTGPITVQIIPGLQKQGLPTFSASLAGSDQTYSIQSVPAGPVVFREVFTKGRQELEQTRSFRVQDTGKRYSLIVQKTGDPTHDGQVNVNINGTAWIKEQDFHGLSQEVQKETLLLQANNSLRVRLKGREGVSVTVTVVEGGESGTILMRRGRLGLPGETQATHVRRNDINIFDPFDSDSLGGLKAFEGDRVDDDGNSIGSLSFNQEEKIEYQSGRILLEFQDAQTSLPEFHRLYGAEVLHQQGQRYLLKLDLSKAPLQDLTSLLSHYNSSIPGNIENVAFGSLASLQTFALFLDIAVHQHDIINAVELNGMMYPQQAVPTCPTSPVP